MPTTTIRLPAELRARVAAAAERSGTTAHGFILEAIAEKTAAAELYDELDDLAEERYARIVATGRTLAWPAMRHYLERHVAGRRVKRPAARKAAR